MSDATLEVAPDGPKTEGSVMTLIAALAPEAGAPLLFGDLLLTSRCDFGKAPLLPFMRRATPVELGGVHLYDLKQKIVMVSPNCAVAWAGNFYHAEAALHGLAELRPTNIETVRGAFVKLKEHINSSRDSQECCLIAMVGRKEGTLVKCDLLQSGHGVAEVRSDGFAHAYVAGSGTRMLAGILPRLRITGSGGGGLPLGMGLTGQLLLEEFRSKATLGNQFGGAFEGAFVDVDGSISKIDDVLSVFCTLRLNEPDGKHITVESVRVLLQTYINDSLVLISSQQPDGRSAAETSACVVGNPVDSYKPTREEVIDLLDSVELAEVKMCALHAHIVQGEAWSFASLCGERATLAARGFSVHGGFRGRNICLEIEKDLLAATVSAAATPVP